MINKRKLLFWCLRFSGLPFLARHFVQRNKVTILLYHDISKETAFSSFSRLKKMYNIISLQDYITWNKNGESDKIPPRALIITFDDGHKQNYELLEVVNELKIPITIFICSAIVGTNRGFWFFHVNNGKIKSKLKKLPEGEFIKTLKENGFEITKDLENREALSNSEINEMKNSACIDFQSHTRFHYILPNCSNKFAKEEIFNSRSELEDKFNIDINAISFPNGDYGEREIELARNFGYKCAITVDYGYNLETDDPYKLKRLSANDTSDLNELIVKASGVWGKIKGL